VPEPARYRVELRAVGPDDVPVVVRLRRLLKVALRAFGLRAVRVEQVEPAGNEPAVTDASLKHKES
jgi:hypothetical protein